ncbi:MAG TPA: PH domain-containing protein [Propionibacteriaceae bacterium]|nr:PH domain-containing protein [Propionibacteriaceae bacterium]
MFGNLSHIIDPHVEQYLLERDGELIVDEVRRHWAAIVLPGLRLAAAVMISFAALFVDSRIAWVPIVLALAVAAQAIWRIVDQHMDRFVITNMRVFRVHGILSQNRATMPMSRILDIAVEKPLLGRVCGYGHFVFESAAQDQGLRDIRFVGRPDERDATIQTVIQRAGLRARMPNAVEDGQS